MQAKSATCFADVAEQTRKKTAHQGTNEEIHFDPPALIWYGFVVNVFLIFGQGILMKKISTFIGASLLLSSAAIAQTSETGAVPSLADVMGSMSEAEVSQMESNVSSAGSLSMDMDVSIEAAVNDAISEGLISADQAEDAAATLEIISSNAEFFNFDILDAIGEVIESGEFSIEDIRQTLEGFNTLSDAGKALVGNETFDSTDTSDGSLFSQLSDADKAIVLNNMPVVGNDQ